MRELHDSLPWGILKTILRKKDKEVMRYDLTSTPPTIHVESVTGMPSDGMVLIKSQDGKEYMFQYNLGTDTTV